MEENENFGEQSPKDLRPATSNRPRTSISNSKTLFNRPSLENRSVDFEIKPKIQLPEKALLLVQNPALLAIRRSAVKQNTLNTQSQFRPKTTINKTRIKTSQSRRSISSTQNEPQQRIGGLPYILATINSPMPSLLTNRPLTDSKIPNFSGEKRIQKEIEDERNSLAFTEDPILYFSKRKDEPRGHCFIYLNYAQEKSDPYFSPYNLVKVPFAEVKEEYFTISSTGVTRIQNDGNTENYSLDQWTRECNEYESIRKFPFFSQYLIWKPFRIWKRFLAQQQYKEIRSHITSYAPYNNISFYKSAIEAFHYSCTKILNDHLLLFNPQKKYPIKEYTAKMERHTNKLIDEYTAFIDNIVSFILECDADIRDPQRIVVKNIDFKESNRHCPKLGEILELEAKKNEEKKRRMKIVQVELNAFASYVRMIDYVLLEDLVATALNCYRKALDNIEQDQSSVFQIEVSFNSDGEVVYQPSFDTLLEIISNVLDNTLVTLDNLPRLLMSKSIRPHLREVIINLRELFDDGPSFQSFADTQSEFKTIKERILTVVQKSFKEAVDNSQTYRNFFPIYETGLNWNPNNYLHERGGKSRFFNLRETYNHKILDGEPLTYDPSTQIIFNFDEIRRDVIRFNEDQMKLSSFRACTICKAIYIDSRSLRSALIPIPSRSIAALQEKLKDVMFEKVEYFQEIFKVAQSRIKREPHTVEEFIDYCDFLIKMEEMTPYITNEIYFLDELFSLFEGCGFKAAGSIEQIRNPFRIHFGQFKKDQKIGLQVKDIYHDRFFKKLVDKIEAVDKKLQDFNKKLQKFPTSLHRLDVDEQLQRTVRIKEKLQKLQPEIEELIACQDIIKEDINDFSLYQVATDAAVYQETLYTSIKSWDKVYRLISTVPFSQVDIADFISLISHLYVSLNQMRNAKKANALLDAVYDKVSTVTPYLDQLDVLSHSKLQLHHWNQLFADCGKPNGYYAQIKIEELISSGVLVDKEKILDIGSTAQGEAKLDVEYNKINSHWKSVYLPILDLPEAKTEENLLIGSVKHIFNDIADTQISLAKMLEYPYSKGIKNHIMDLSSKLETLGAVLEEWKVFQRNWMVLHSLYSSDQMKSVLQQCVNRFNIAKRRWVTFVKHVGANTHVFHILQYPSILELFKENNNTIDYLMQSLYKFINAKRERNPRFYFLSNDEMTTLLSTNDFSAFNNQIIKLFMDVQSLDFRQQDMLDYRTVFEPQNFQRIRIHGIRGNADNYLPFNKVVHCNGLIESWVANIVDRMRISFKELLINSIKHFSTTTNIQDWIFSYPINVIMIATNAIFTNELQECFNNFENNIRTFIQYRALFEERLKKIIDSYTQFSQAQRHKIAIVLMHLKYLLEQTLKVSHRTADSSQQFVWNNTLQTIFDENEKTFTIKFDDFKQDFGYEFFGNPRMFVHCQNSGQTLQNMFRKLCKGEHLWLTGGNMIGKTQITKSAALFFGRPIFIAPTFNDHSFTILKRMVYGAITSGSWLILKNIEKHNTQNLLYLFDAVNEIQNDIKSEFEITNIDGKEIGLNPHCRFIITTNYLNNNSTEIPSTLRAHFKPIGLMAPNIYDIIFSIFYSHGFQHPQELTDNSFNAITSIERIFNYLKIFSVFKPMLKIARSSIDMLTETRKKKSYINYEKDSLMAEKFIVARSIYFYFIHQIRNTNIDLFFDILYSNFHLFDDIETFKSRIMKSKLFEYESVDEQIRQIVAKEIEARGNCLPVHYFQTKIISLYHLLHHTQAVIIAGDPNTGKSLVVELLKLAIDELRKEEDKEVQFALDNFDPNDPPPTKHEYKYIPMKIYDMYHSIDSFENLFGIASLNNQGPYYSLLQTYFVKMNKNQGKFHTIIRFNGPLTTSFSNFLLESLQENSFKTNTFDTIYFQKNVNFIIETDDISHLSPKYFKSCAILPMRNYQNIISKPLNCEITGTKIIFDRLKPKLLRTYSSQVVQQMQEIFEGMAPSVISLIYSLKNDVYSTETTIQMNGGQAILCNHFSYLSLKYADYYIQETDIDTSDPNKLKTALAFAFFSVFSRILEPANISTFDTWIRSTYEINIPLDWDGYEVGDHFWDVFPRPCLQAMYHKNNELVPLDYTLLNESPYIISTERTKTLMLLKDFNVLTANFLPILKQSSILMKNHENLLIYGPKGCGKTTFLNLLCKDMNDISPVHMPISCLTTPKLFIEFLTNHTTVVKPNYLMDNNSKTYALIFDNIDSNNIQLLEFIRMLATTCAFDLVSENDPKNIKRIKLHNFFIIAITENIYSLPPRFVSHFTPIQVPQPTQNTIRYIFQRISRIFGVDREIIKNLLNFTFEQNIPQFNVLRLLELLVHMNKRSCEAGKYQETCLRTILAEFNLFYYHKASTIQKEKFGTDFKTLFTIKDASVILTDFIEQNTLYVPDIQYKEGEAELIVKVLAQQEHLVYEELMFHFANYNVTHPDKLILKFYKSIITRYNLLQRAISYPSGVALLKGETGIGRKTLTKYTCSLKNYEFYELPEVDCDEENLIRIFMNLMIKTIEGKKIVVAYLRVTDENPKTFELVKSLIESHCFSIFFSEYELIGLYHRYKKVASIDPNFLLSTFYLIKDKVMMNLRFVISVDNEFDSSQIKNAYSIHYDITDTAEYEDIALVSLSKSIYRNKCASLPSIFAEIHNSLCPQFLNIHINQFYDFLAAFDNFSQIELDNLTSRHENETNAVEYLKFIAATHDTLEKKINELTPQIVAMKSQVDKTNKEFNSKKQAIEGRLNSIQSQEDAYLDDLDDLKDELNDMKNDLQQDLDNIAKSAEIAKNLKEAEIAQLQSFAEKPPNAIKRLISFLCIFVDLSSDYNVGGKQFLANRNFYTIVKQINHLKLSGKALALASNFLRENRMEKDEFKMYSSAAAHLYQWLIDVYSYARDNVQIESLNERIAQLEAELEEFRNEKKQEKDSIIEVKTSLEEDLKENLETVGDYEEFETELNMLKSQNRTAVQILDDIGLLRQKLVRSLNDYSSAGPMITGNSILLAAYVVYGGSLEYEKRIDFLTQLVELLDSSNIAHSKEEPIIMISQKLALHDTSRELLRVDPFLSQDTQRDYRHILSSIRTPLIMDIDGFVVAHLLARIKETKLVRISLMANDFDQVLTNALKTGKTLVVDDVDYLHPLLESILPLKVLGNNPEIDKSIRVTEKTIITKHPKFKMYLLTNKRAIKQLPKNLLARVSLIKTVLNSSINMMITAKIFQTFYPEKKYTPSVDKMETKIKLLKYEMDTVDFMSEMYTNSKNDEEYSFCDDEMLSDMLRTKRDFLDMSHSHQTGADVAKRKEEMAYAPFIKVCRSIWFTISRYMPKIGIQQHFMLPTFLNSISAAIEQSPKDIEPMKRSLFHSVFTTFSSMLNINESIFMMFTASFFIKAQEGKSRTNEFKPIIQHCVNELNGVVDQNINDFFTGDPIDQLKFSNISNIFYFVTRQISDYFGPFDQYLSTFKFENFVSNDPKRLNLIQIPHSNDFLETFLAYVSYQARQTAFEYHMLYDDNDHLELIKYYIFEAMKKGNWIALFYVQPSYKVASIINYLYYQIQKGTPHEEFRLILICNDLSLLPATLLNHDCYCYHNFPLVRSEIQEIYKYFSTMTRFVKEEATMQRIAFMTSLVLAAINFRRMVAPCGFINSPYFSPAIMKDVIFTVKTLLDMPTKKTPFKNLIELYIRNIFGVESIDLFDQQKIQNMIHFMISPEILIPNFNFTIRDCWKIPKEVNDTTLSKLPSISTVDLLLMEEKYGTPLRNWNLSKYLVSAFPVDRSDHIDDIDDLKTKLSSIMVSLPSIIQTQDELMSRTPLSLFLLSEIQRFNNCLIEVKGSIIEKNYDICINMRDEIVPNKWCEMSGYKGISGFNKFLTYLKDKYNMLINWMTERKPPKYIDVAFISNVKGLFQAFLNDVAIKTNSTIDTLSFFYTTDENEINNEKITFVSQDTLILVNIWLMCGYYDKEINMFTDNTRNARSFSKMPPIICKVIKIDKISDSPSIKTKETKENFLNTGFSSVNSETITISKITGKTIFKCPLFKSVPLQEFSVSEDFDRYDGIIENFVQNIDLPTNEPEWRHAANGTALICHISDRFV